MVLDSIANEPRFHVDMDFEPGDMQFLKNAVILHSRTEYGLGRAGEECNARSIDPAGSREMDMADKQPEKSSVVRPPMPVAVIVRGGVWLGQLGDRHWQSPAFISG